MRRTTIIIIISSLVFAVLAWIYVNRYFSAFAPAKVKITRDWISSDKGLEGNIVIQKVGVDSMGEGEYPVKYTAVYTAFCQIGNGIERRPPRYEKIYFQQEGNYSWRGDSTNNTFIHEGLHRRAINSTSGRPLTTEFKTCPIKFKKGEWYYFTIDDPRITGIFFYIDEQGEGHQYDLHSGVSPI